MPRKPDEIVTETYKITSIAVHNAETHGGVLLKVENPEPGAEEYLQVDDATFYVPSGAKVNLWKLIQWFRESKNVKVEVNRLPKKYMKVKEARFSVEPETA